MWTTIQTRAIGLNISDRSLRYYCYIVATADANGTCCSVEQLRQVFKVQGKQLEERLQSLSSEKLIYIRENIIYLPSLLIPEAKEVEKDDKVDSIVNQFNKIFSTKKRITKSIIENIQCLLRTYSESDIILAFEYRNNQETTDSWWIGKEAYKANLLSITTLSKFERLLEQAERAGKSKPKPIVVNQMSF